jgi:hypothetical protein
MDEAENNIGNVKIVWRQGVWFRNHTPPTTDTRYHENTARPCLHIILTFPMSFSASSMCTYTP